MGTGIGAVTETIAGIGVGTGEGTDADDGTGDRIVSPEEEENIINPNIWYIFCTLQYIFTMYIYRYNSKWI